MARIDLVENGFLYATTFTSIDPVWILSPDGPQCVSLIEGGGLRLDSSASASGAVLALYSPLQPPYVVEAELEYGPSLVEDNAGLVLWANSDDAIYLSIVAGGVQYEKLRFRVIGERCEAYAFSASTGLWEVAGTAYISPDMLPGLYAEGQAPVVVKRVAIARDTRITVGNLPAGHSVFLFNVQGVFLAQAQSIDGAAVLPVGHFGLSFEGELQVRDQNGNIIATTGVTTINGGSVYWYNAFELNLYLDGALVSPGQEISLGPLVNGLIERRLEVENAGAASIADVTIRCVAFNVYHGYQWTSLAPEVDGAPGQYGDRLYIPSLAPGERVPCWLKVERPAGVIYYPFTEHRFALLITTGSGEAAV